MIEIRKRPGGDEMDIYLKLDDRNWYYFGYTRELMQVISSDQTFNDRLASLPEKQRQMDDKQRPGFRFMISSNEKLEQFLRIYRQAETQTDQLPPPTMIQDAVRPVITPTETIPVKKEEDEVLIKEVD
jgi:hypothetical protein